MRAATWTAFALIATAMALRIAYLGWLSPLDLAPDEAHYWHWSRHLDWSYYSKGPLVALLIRASCELFGGWSLAWTGSEMLAVRLPAALCGAGTLAALFTLTARTTGCAKTALATLAVAALFPAMAAGSSLMTIDAPLACCWAWALVTAHRAAIDDRPWAWAAAGVWVALGILAKHTMVLFVPFVGLFLLATPSLRTRLLRPGFWTMACIGALGAAPILGWNAFHGWVTFRHTQGHIGVTSARLVHWAGPLVFFGTQAGLMLGYWFVAYVAAAVTHRPTRERDLSLRFLWFLSAPMLLFFAAFSLKNGGGEPNWPLMAYLAGAPLTALWLREQLRAPSFAWRAATAAGIALVTLLGAGATLVVHLPTAFRPVFVALAGPANDERPMPLRRFDPTCRLRGWRTLAAAVDEIRDGLSAEGVDPVLAGVRWDLPGELAFHCRGNPEAFSLGSALGDRHSQYDLWHPNPVADVDAFAGRTFVIVGSIDAVLSPAFERVEPTRTIEHREGGHLVAAWTVTLAHGYRGFPASRASRW